MVTTDEAPPLPGTTFAGEKRQVAPDGNPEHDSPTELLTVPPKGVRLIEKVPEDPRGIVMLLVFGAIAKSTAVPLMPTLCGLVLALSLNTREPVQLP